MIANRKMETEPMLVTISWMFIYVTLFTINSTYILPSIQANPSLKKILPFIYSAFLVIALSVIIKINSANKKIQEKDECNKE